MSIDKETCDASYVGQTSRQLITRIKENRYNINRPLSGLSVISEHHLRSHKFDWDFILVLDENPSYRKRKYLISVTYTAANK